MEPRRPSSVFPAAGAWVRQRKEAVCLVFRASVVAKVEFFQHLCAVTGPCLMENSVWEWVQLGERCTSVPAQSAGQHLQDQGGATSGINSILLGPDVRPWGASPCGAVSWVPTEPAYSALRRLGLEDEKEFTLQTREGQGWHAEVVGRGWSEQAEKLTVSCVFGPRVCWRQNWWLGRFLATPPFLWGVVTCALWEGTPLPGRRCPADIAG